MFVFERRESVSVRVRENAGERERERERERCSPASIIETSKHDLSSQAIMSSGFNASQ